MIGAQARHLGDLRVYDFSRCDVVVPYPWTFAGGGGGGRRRMDLGTINAVSAGQPRIQYSPTGGVGVMIEAERITKTAGGETPQLGGAGGTYTTDGLASLLADPGVLGPTGEPMGHLVRANAAGYAYTGTTEDFVAGRLTGRSIFLRRGTIGQAAPHVMAAMFVFGPGAFAVAYVDLDAGVIYGAPNGGAALIDWGGGLYELQQWGIPGASAGGIVDVNILGMTDGDGHYVGCDCISDGLPPTFFEGTTPAESLTCTDLAALGLNQDAFTIFVTAGEPYPDPTPGYLMILRIEGDAGSVLTINKQPDGQIEFQIFDGSVNVSQLMAAGTPGTQRVYAIGYSRAQQIMRVAATGTAVVDESGASLATLPALGTARLGSANGFWWVNQVIAQFAIAPRLMTEGEILEKVNA